MVDINHVFWIWGKDQDTWTQETSKHLYPGVNIFQNKCIFHPGKVYHFEHFREEFPNFVIRALCRKLSFLLQGNITFLPFPSLAGNHSFPRKEPFSKRETHPLQRNPSLTGIPFPCTKTHLLKWNSSLVGIVFPGRNSLPWKPIPCRETNHLQGNPFLARKGYTCS